MSALLDIEVPETIDINSEWGLHTRTFSKNPNVYETDSTNPYNSCMFLVYRTKKLIPNWIKAYTNHFTMFANKTNVIINRTETSLIHQNIDAVQTVQNICPTKCSRVELNEGWIISRDDIIFSENFDSSDCKMLCAGEWWFYDKGYILNGIGNGSSWFIYYELHAPTLVKSNKKTTALNLFNINDTFDTIKTTQNSDTPCLDVDNNLDLAPKPPSILEKLDKLFTSDAFNKNLTPNRPTVGSKTPNLLSTVRPIVSNFNTKPSNLSRFQNILPSKFWLVETAKELESGNIDKFKATNGFLPTLGATSQPSILSLNDFLFD